MLGWHRGTRSDHGRDWPPEIYISLVDSLYSDARSLFVGFLATSSAVFLTAWRTGEKWLLLCAVALTLLACARFISMCSYARRRPGLTSVEAVHRWESYYALSAAAYVALLGAWCVIAFALTQDAFVHVLSISVTIAHLIGIAGRNFGSNRLVAAQILCASIPITAALMLAGDAFYFLFAGILLPFYLSLKFISDRLRNTLLDAVTSARDIRLLADRFDTALNNMPHGLCMFDAGRRLVVSNDRLTQLLGVSRELARPGASARELLLDCRQAGTALSSRPDRFLIEFERRLAGRGRGPLVAEMHDGRTLALTFQAMGNGGSVVLVEDITERKTAEAKINHLARYDALTGLPNRTFFREQMDRALSATRRNGSCAVLFIDLDQFKQVNDTLGHPCGDELLCAVADRLRLLVRESDIVARFGGDEFVVLQLPAARPEEAASLARRIVDAFAVPHDIEGHHIIIGASIGIAMAPGDGTDTDLLLKNADMALYRAKCDGRDGWRFFEPEMDVMVQARRSLEVDLRNALATDAFDVHYQPVVNLKTRRIATCEALLRWPHPVRGMVSPAEFIPVAEEMGLIVEIGNWVLRNACLECMRWPNDVRVAVNLSPIQFKRGNVLASVRDALAASGLPASRLEVEITESVLLQDTTATRVALYQLRDLGVRISLDDFGTGYSSLSYLHNFPLHKVKIDRSFLEDIAESERSQILLRGVARLSAELGMLVVIEGIETDEQLALVARESSIHEAQGYLFSRPVPSRDIRKLLYAAPAQMQVA